jgi:hypothetical protein
MAFSSKVKKKNSTFFPLQQVFSPNIALKIIGPVLNYSLREKLHIFNSNDSNNTCVSTNAYHTMTVSRM